MPHTAVITFPGVETVGRLARDPLALAALHGGQYCGRDAPRYFVLHCEDIGEVAVIALGPEMSVGRCLDQLPGHPYPVAGLAHAAFENVAHSKFTADLLDAGRAALVGEARIPGDDKQQPRFRQQSNDVLRDTVREV